MLERSLCVGSVLLSPLLVVADIIQELLAGFIAANDRRILTFFKCQTQKLSNTITFFYYYYRRVLLAVMT